MNKSWALTLIAFIVAIGTPFINDHLEPHGFIVTPEELDSLLFTFFAAAGIGGLSAATKRKYKANGGTPPSGRPSKTRDPTGPRWPHET